jgi:predicted DNA-binding transcriptional regulator AlpA
MVKSEREPLGFITRLPQRRASRPKRHGLISKGSDTDAQESRWVTGPTLRRLLNISAVTLWRWRHNNRFPAPKSINGRLYFPWHKVEAWLQAQPDAT